MSCTIENGIEYCLNIYCCNLYITMKNRFNMNWIMEVEEQLQKRIDSGNLREGQELHCEKALI